MRIAVTGTIGSGKSEACNYLRSLGYDVFDCDQVNRKLLDENAYELLHNDFPECFSAKKVLNKRKLSKIVFNDPERKVILEGIMHPLILRQLKLRKDNPLFAEVPLLFESGWDRYFKHKLLIVCDEDIALERLVSRGLDKDEAVSRINNQMSVEEKIKKADRIIYNNGSLDDLYALIDEYLDEIL